MKFFSLVFAILILFAGSNGASVRASDDAEKPLNTVELRLDHLRDNSDIFADAPKEMFNVMMGAGDKAHLCIGGFEEAKLTEHLVAKGYEFNQESEQCVILEKNTNKVGLVASNNPQYQLPIILAVAADNDLPSYVTFNVRSDNEKAVTINVVENTIINVYAATSYAAYPGHKPPAFGVKCVAAGSDKLANSTLTALLNNTLPVKGCGKLSEGKYEIKYDGPTKNLRVGIDVMVAFDRAW